MNALRLVPLAVALSASAALRAQVTTAWAAVWTNSGYTLDRVTAVKADAAGNVYVTGSVPVPTDTGNPTDIVTVKYDPAGNELWVRRYDGPIHGFDRPVALAIDSRGNAYIAGASEKTVPSTGPDFVTIKYAPDGAELWVRRYDGPIGSGDEAADVVVDANDDVYVTGRSRGPTVNYAFATLKYSPDGALLWERRYSGGSGSYPSAMALDPQGNVLVTGWTYVDQADFAVVKYSPTGTQLWARTYGHALRTNDRSFGIAVDAGGNATITGHTFVEDQRRDGDYLTLRYAADGTLSWVRTYNGPGNRGDWAVRVRADANGNSIVTGTSYGLENTDVATLQYSPTGETLWESRYNGHTIYVDEAFDMALDAQGNSYVLAYDQLYSDFVVLKYSPIGDSVWVATYNRGPGTTMESPVAMTLDRFGAVIAAGTLFSSASGYDYLTVKLSQNRPPVVSAPSSIQAECDGTGADVSLFVTAADPDADPLVVRLIVGGEVVASQDLQDGGTVTFTHRFPMGTSSAVIEVFDGTNTVTGNTTVSVVDTTAATLTVAGSLEVTVEAGMPYVDAGATAVDTCHGDLTDQIVTSGLEGLSTEVPGDFAITYSVTDPCSLLTTTAMRIVRVVDTTPPVITLNEVDGQVDLTIEVGTSYAEPGASATDLVDGAVDVTIGGQAVDPAVTGVYRVEYTARDSRGNEATEVRTVTVVDTTRPVIDSYPAEVQVRVDASASAAAPDVRALVLAHDGSGTNVTIEQDVAPGTVLTGLGDGHVIAVTVTDSAGNQATCQVRVRLVACVEGFLQPLADLVVEGHTPPLPPRAFLAGRVLPLRMRLCGGGTSLGSALVSPPRILQIVRDGSPLPLDIMDLDAGASSDGGPDFRDAEGQWVYNLSTANWASGTYEITILAPDGRRLVGAFVLR